MSSLSNTTYLRTPLIAIVVVTILATTGSPVSAETKQIVEVESLLEDSELIGGLSKAAKCSSSSEYAPEDAEYSDTFNDDGHAVFWTTLESPGLLGYGGSGGHTGEVWMCKSAKCAGGWLPVVGKFRWAGGSVLGYGASATIHSEEKKTPVLFKSCGGMAADFLVAQSRARSLDGKYAADATHGGLLTSSSSGSAELTADANLAGAYSYAWSYKGKSSVLGLDKTVKEAIGCDKMTQICERITLLPIEVHGTGRDTDSLS